MTDATALDVRHQVQVRSSAEHAFHVFTEMFTTWWPMAHHIGDVDPEAVVIEGREGGRWYERGTDGTECQWGWVSTWDPPHRLVLAWHLSPDFVFDPDPARATEVEVTFSEEGDGTTTVVLVHRGFEVHGPELAARLSSSVGAAGGWPGILGGFAAAV
jgi:uncharacterized protein YndB with AHSA1/START domain